MRIARGLAALSVTSVAILGLTACSVEGAPKTSTSVDRAASTAPSDEATTAPSDELTADNFASRLTAASHKAGSMTMALDGADTMSLTADVVFTDTSQNMSITMSLPGTEDIELRVVDKIVYVGFGAAMGNKFMEIDPSDPDNPNASSYEYLLDSMDRYLAVDSLDGAITSIEKVGSLVDIDGVQAQQYEVIVDASKISGTVADQLGEDTSLLPSNGSYRYWVDKDDLMRKMTIDAGGVAMTSTFSDWGKDLNIAAPSADEIMTT